MDYKQKYKIRTVDFYLMIIFLLFTSVSHLIASKIFTLPFTTIPLISSSFTYMFCMTLTDLVRAYSTKRNAFKFLIIEMIFVLLLLIITLLFTSIASPAWANISHLSIAFTLALSVYKTNFVSICITIVLDILLFSVFFNKTFSKLSLYLRFIVASILSTTLTITIYTYIVNIYIYKLFPQEWLRITVYNIISNIVMIVFYSFVCSIIFKFINLYLEKE